MSELTINLAVVTVLLAANGFFVAAEFALVKARGTRIQSLADAGSPAARLTLQIHQNLEAYLAAAQLGITMASLGLGWVGEPTVATILAPLFAAAGLSNEALHLSAFLAGFLIFSSLHIVVGEQVPKAFAIRKAEPVSLWVAYPLHICFLVTYPLSWCLNRAARGILGLFNVAEATHAEVYNDKELMGLVSVAQMHGDMSHAKADMLRNLFEFDQRTVDMIMVPRNAVRVLDVADTPEITLAILRDSGHSRFPLIDGDNNNALLGMVLAKDVFTAMLNGADRPWRDLRPFARKPLVVPEGQRVPNLFEAMRVSRAHMALVVDEYGAFAGAVTLEDLLEEIVGEIADETDVAESTFAIRGVITGGWVTDGLCPITDVERAIGIHVPDDVEANTLSGLFAEHLGRMPETGDVIEVGGFSLTVRSVNALRVGEVLIQRLKPADSPETAVPENGARYEGD